jgi:polysaccharide export outer membrane protein
MFHTEMKPQTYTSTLVGGQNRGLPGFQAFFMLCLLAISMLTLQAPKYAGNESELVDDTSDSYRLGAGDKLQIDVFNQGDLSGEYILDGEGRISMPLIGYVKAAGLTATELSGLLVSKLKPDYLVNPRISVRVKGYRPYYLIGEVRSTGTFAYVDGMTYLTAVAIAGGFTYRAKKDHVYVVRADDTEREEIKLDIGEKVRPGDIIRVAERIF